MENISLPAWGMMFPYKDPENMIQVRLLHMQLKSAKT